MKIIFLDIDGPVISAQAPMIDSEMRLSYIQESIELLNQLCEKTGAKIVTNSSHNYHIVNGNTIKDDLIKWGIDSANFHEKWRTIFPYIDYTKVKSNIRGIGRFIAIDKWQADNEHCNWVCFDDRKFTISFRLIHISDGNGITKENIDTAIEILGLSE